jgi:GR25 family glycosyltransferase involved in LPS biosynthesis
LEDDAVIPEDIKEISYYVKNAPIDWDMIFLGFNKLGCKIKKNTKNSYVKMHKECMPGGFAYIIRKRAAQYVLNFIFPIQYPLDVYFQKNSENLNIYLYYPDVITTDYNNQTTIHNSGY